MTATSIPTMLVDDVELRARPSILTSHRDPFDCDHVWAVSYTHLTLPTILLV